MSRAHRVRPRPVDCGAHAVEYLSGASGMDCRAFQLQIKQAVARAYLGRLQSVIELEEALRAAKGCALRTTGSLCHAGRRSAKDVLLAPK